MRSKGQVRYKKAFGEALDAQLRERGMTQSSLANLTSRSVSYVNKTMTAERFISPEWVDAVAAGLNLSQQETKRFHTLAALDMGYRLDLTNK
jgi:hypothetical protein